MRATPLAPEKGNHTMLKKLCGISLLLLGAEFGSFLFFPRSFFRWVTFLCEVADLFSYIILGALWVCAVQQECLVQEYRWIASVKWRIFCFDPIEIQDDILRRCNHALFVLFLNIPLRLINVFASMESQERFWEYSNNCCWILSTWHASKSHW